MPDFSYIARDLNGNRVTGRLQAGSQHEALAMLDAKALFPLEVREAKQRQRGGRRIKTAVVSVFYGQLADLLRSGVPLLRSLEVLSRQASNAALAAVLEDIQRQVQDGQPLAAAMARHPRVFGEMAISMVRAGAEGGFLEDALERVAEFTEQQDELKGRTMGALAYPMVLAVAGTLIVTVLLVFFVPKFAPMFDRLRSRGSLPWLTDALLNTSDMAQRYWWLVAAAVAGLVVFYKAKTSTEAGRMWRDRLKLKLPLVGDIFRNFAVARFCRVLGTLLRNGVPILRSLEISRDAVGNRVLSEAVGTATENITAGESLAKPLASCGHFPVSVVEMIAVAEESNSLDRVLIDIADGLERRTWRQLDLFVRLLEPAMLFLVAGMVMLLAVALLLPVVTMSSAM